MDTKNLEKALEIATLLIQGEEVGKKSHVTLYEEYTMNSDVYEIVEIILKKWNLSLYEYQDALYISAGESNRVFGFTNEELKRELGVRLNRELYLCYFIIFIVLTKFYNDSGSYNFTEYIRIPDVVSGVDSMLGNVMNTLDVLVIDEIEESSFKAIAMVWADLPATGRDEQAVRAVRTTRAGLAKLVLNFMTAQNLLVEAQERYYPKKRFQALAEQYFEENRGRLYEILNANGRRVQQKSGIGFWEG